MKKIISISISFILITLSLMSCTNEEEIVKSINSPIIATWINYEEIKMIVNSSNSYDEFLDAVKNNVLKLSEYGINTIFLHVRAFDDSFYKSEITPPSDYCAVNGNLQYDILRTFIDVCKNYDIQIHAWINPYRIRNDSDLSKIKSSYANSILKENEKDEKIIITDNSVYYNPAYLENQQYILSCAREILNNYEIDGIHIDDYFYPIKNDEIDSIIYKKYVDSGGTQSKADFRRENVNSLVISLYNLVKSFDEKLIFSISPNANIEYNFNELYADVKLWSSESGYADYIIPQIYYGFDNSKMPFTEILKKWLELNKGENKIIIGLAVYKCGIEDIYAGTGKNEWIDNSSIISKQIKFAYESGCDGVAFYSASHLYNTSSMLVNQEKNNIKNLVNNWMNNAT